MLSYLDDPAVERFVARRATGWRQEESAVILELEGVRDPDRTDIAAILAGAPLNDAIDRTELTVMVLETGAVRLLLGATAPRDLGLLEEIDVAPLSVTTSDGTLRLASERHGGYGPDPEDLTVQVTLDPLGVTVLDAGGKVVVGLPPYDATVSEAARVAPLAWMRWTDDDGTDRRASAVTATLEPEERLFGLGARTGPLSLIGTNCTAPPLADAPTDGARGRPPFLLSSRGYGVLVHTAAGLTADLGVRLAGVYTLVVDEPSIDLLILPSSWPRTALAGYARLTGRVDPPEESAFGLPRDADAEAARQVDSPGDAPAMRALVQQALSFGLTVPGYWQAPLGRTEPHAEAAPLAVRWAQVALLAPLVARSIDLGDDSSDTAAVVRAYARLRRRLLPYLLHCARETAQSGLPMLRPLLLEFSWDPVAVDVDDQLLLGRDLLIAPIFSEAAEPVSRRVYLPGFANWYDWWTGTLYEGRQWIETTAPLERLPLYVRAGTVIPVTASAPDPDSAISPDVPIRLLLFTPRDGAIGASVELADDDMLGVEQERGDRKARV
ncbi:MAG: glycoside hydrolase family 31 protein, partial [Chloroflexota bacterium]